MQPFHGPHFIMKAGEKTSHNTCEEEKVVNYNHSTARLGHPISLLELRIKVVEATPLCQTPFTDCILGSRWLRWFRNRHPDVSLRLLQGLDVGRTKGLYP
jgi:hypothetical protein